MSLLEARNVAIPGRLEPTTLTAEAGELICLVGPNGSGKTSLLHALARIGRPGGSVRIGGMDPDTLAPAARPALVTYLPASRDLAWPLAARDLVALSGAADVQVEGAMERLELGAFANRRADRLSTGERSRVLIARAFASQPRLLLLDEPTSNLDPLWQIRLMEMVRAEVGGGDRAAIVAMHDLDVAGRYADRLIVMSEGRVASDGRPAEVLASPVMPQIFGIERTAGGWRPAFNPEADRRSSR